MAIGGLKMNLVQDFKLLGHRCVAAHKFVNQDADEAAVEAKLRVQRIGTLPVQHQTKLNLLKTSPMKVLTAPTQWARAKLDTLRTLTTEILKVVWGKTRKLRSSEVVFGLLYEAADFHPISAMVWQSLANARRMFAKDPAILQQTKETLKLRERLEEEECLRQRRKIEALSGASSGSGGVWPHSGFAGAAVEPDPSRPHIKEGDITGDPREVGFGLSCERIPMASGPIGELSALSARQRPHRGGVQDTVCVTMGPSTSHGTNAVQQAKRHHRGSRWGKRSRSRIRCRKQVRELPVLGGPRRP